MMACERETGHALLLILHHRVDLWQSKKVILQRITRQDCVQRSPKREEKHCKKATGTKKTKKEGHGKGKSL